MKLPNPYVGIAPPLGVKVPDADEIVHNICSEKSQRSSFAYPREAPTFWIKYGTSVRWNEVCAQVMACEGLRRLGSEVRAPAVFYAQMNYPVTYIVMEYIPGKTAGQCLSEAQDDNTKELLSRSVSLAISELHRLPIDPGTRPAAISGGRIQYSLLWETNGAPLHYENVQQMEDHFNAFLAAGSQKARFQNLAQEPLVFCQADLYPDNFIMSPAHDRVTVIDFADTSVLPASFAKLAVLSRVKQGLNLRRHAVVPMAEGIDNVGALRSLSYLMVMARGSFVTLGRRMRWGDAATQSRYNELYSDNPELDKLLPPGGWALVALPGGGIGRVPAGEEIKEPEER